jgi:2-polyprenyl-3-methyl-5-hydroxy-6-metoxy-1,4-benzoquinol methylase
MGHKFDPKNVARLDDPARLDYQPVRNVLGLLELTGSETVVDYGAGVGYLTLPLAGGGPRRGGGGGGPLAGSSRST